MLHLCDRDALFLALPRAENRISYAYHPGFRPRDAGRPVHTTILDDCCIGLYYRYMLFGR